MRLPARLAISAFLAGSLVLGTAAPAAADYGGRVDSTTYGAQFGFTLRFYNPFRAYITGEVRDVRADGYCANVRVKMYMYKQYEPIPSPSTTVIVCGKGNTAPFSMDRRTPIVRYPDGTLLPAVIRRVEIRVCRQQSVGVLKDCKGRNLTNSTT